MHNWQQLNQQYLSVAIIDVRNALQQYVDRLQGKSATVGSPLSNPELQALRQTLTATPALERLCTGFRLTTFERQVVLLCAGVELSASLANLCALAQDNSRLTYPTFSLALAVLPEADWSALAQVAPLRRWRLIEVANGESLTQSRLRIDERVLHYLTGVSYLDDRLQGLIHPIPRPNALSPSHQQLADQITQLWTKSASPQKLIIQLCSPQLSPTAAIAATVCKALNMQGHTIPAMDIPTMVTEREALARLWERESVLLRSVLLVNCQEMEGRDRLRTLLAFIRTLGSRVIIATREPLPIAQPATIRLDVPALSVNEQRLLWHQALNQVTPQPEQAIDLLIAQFDLSAETIQSIVSEMQLNQLETQSEETAAIDLDTLWAHCRQQTRTQLDDLAQRIPPIATWNNLVLPEGQRQILQEITAQVRQRTTVYETWEFAVRGANGLGISALFVGVSGTGKTMAAEVMANELQLDLYRIDLSQVVSKYIGETEKNLRRVFDAAETGGAILLFDEADALFGKRSEVKDSHDRYANIEVSYLLQRMEAYRGLAILTTNLKSAIDPAFLRRIRFVVQFPFPDVAQRIEIWRRMIPPKLPTAELNFTQLARLNVTGGNIRNIALNAAFLAADAGESLHMKHLLRSARTEYSKLERSLTDAEIGGWV